MTLPQPAASILERLTAVPEDADVALMIRHAEREAIPSGAFGRDVGLTGQGIRSSEWLGAALSEKRTICVVSSPVWYSRRVLVLNKIEATVDKTGLGRVS